MAFSTSHLHFSSTKFKIPSNPFSKYHYCSKIGLENRIINHPRKIVASRREAGVRRHGHPKNDGGSGSGPGDGGGGRMVDENIVILRKRICEMKMVEKNNYEPPSHWSVWERKYHTLYDFLVCQSMGLLQAQMMKSRPSSVLGLTILILFSVPTCSALILIHFVEIAKGVLAAGTVG